MGRHVRDEVDQAASHAGKPPQRFERVAGGAVKVALRRPTLDIPLVLIQNLAAKQILMGHKRRVPVPFEKRLRK